MNAVILQSLILGLASAVVASASTNNLALSVTREAREVRRALLRKYDVNQDGVLDKGEREMIRKEKMGQRANVVQARIIASSRSATNAFHSVTNW
jgi:hypothetical protein